MTDPTVDRGADGGREEPRVRVTDKRRTAAVPPSGGGPTGSGEASEPDASPAPAGTAPTPEALLAERTEDLLRVKAEFDNYRRRVDRDRAGWGEQAVAKVLSGLLPALDDIDRARAYGELDGAFRAVAEAVEKAVGGTGLERFGSKGESFDPSRHEALQSVTSPAVDRETVADVFRAGYSYAGRVLRPAQVVVATPEPAQPGADAARVSYDEKA